MAPKPLPMRMASLPAPTPAMPAISPAAVAVANVPPAYASLSPMAAAPYAPSAAALNGFGAQRSSLGPSAIPVASPFPLSAATSLPYAPSALQRALPLAPQPHAQLSSFLSSHTPPLAAAVSAAAAPSPAPSPLVAATAASTAASAAAAAAPPTVQLVDSIAAAATGAAGPLLLLRRLPASVSLAALGQQFCVFGRLVIKLFLTVSHGIPGGQRQPNRPRESTASEKLNKLNLS